MIKKGDEIELKIDSLAFGAEGIGRYKTGDGSLAVFVEDTVPGDIVRVRIGTRKKSFARGYVIDFIKKSGLRIRPRCKHFGSCGGCVLQHLSYEDQLQIKEQQVRDAIKRIGGFDDKVVLPIIGCAEPWFYRNKMEFSFSRRTDSGSAAGDKGELTLGLHVRRRHHDLIELEECFLLNDYVGGLVKGVRDFFRIKDREGRLGEEMKLLSMVVRESKSNGEIMVNLLVENGEPDFLSEYTDLLKTLLKGKNPASIYFTQIVNFKGRPKKIHEMPLWGKETIIDSLTLENGKRLDFEISPQAFFQPNTRQAEVLYGEVMKAAKLSGGEIVFDLFCGAGTIGSFCAHAAKKVYGIEINESAVKNATANAALNGISNIEFILGDTAKVLPQIKDRPDVVIVDPPRGGMDINALDLIASLCAKRIVYVSCNPSTLARDLNLLKKTGYSLLSVQPVDMFPQTYHIECVAGLQKLFA